MDIDRDVVMHILKNTRIGENRMGTTLTYYDPDRPTLVGCVIPEEHKS